MRSNMREIKFRVWDKEEKTMFPPATLEEIVDNIDMGLPVSIDGWRCDGDNLGDRDRFVWLQYTGLKDKNGKEIYDGDVIETGGARGGIVGKVVYIEEGFSIECELGYEDFYWDTLEVIGNIYENPELIK